MPKIFAVMLAASLLAVPAARAEESPFGHYTLTGPCTTALISKSQDADLWFVVLEDCDPEDGGTPTISFAAPAAAAVFAAAIIPHDRHWSMPHWPASLSALPPLTQYALWREPSGGYGAMINATGGGMISYVESIDGRLGAMGHSYDRNYRPKFVPLFAFGRGEDPYALTRKLYAFALACMREQDPAVRGRLRVEKAYPEIFKYVGWCSWNSYYQSVNAAGLYGNARAWREAGFPMRWMIIDDGWEQLVANKDQKTNGRVNSLIAFEADPKKFPGGLAPAVKKLKAEYGMTWVGVWNTLQGYWNAVDLDSEIGVKYRENLMPVTAATAIPDPRGDNGRGFYDAYYGFMKGAGVDFIKTDDQSTMEDFIRDQYPIGLAYAHTQHNFQDVAEKYFGSNALNCMSMNVDSIYQWDRTNLARASRDYYPAAWHNPRTHQVDAVMNALWLENVVWPDYDMWETYNWHADYNAVARAISGGPVYVTDKEGREKWEKLWPLVWADGEAIRADEPGRPARKSLLVDPYTGRVPFMAFAPVGRGGAVAVWNMDRYERPERGALTAADVEGIAGEEFAVYEFFAKQFTVLKRGQELPLRLSGWDARIYSIVPVQDGFAAVGLADKYLAGAAVREVKREDGKATVRLREAGTFVAYSLRQPRAVKVDGAAVAAERTSWKDGLLRVELGRGAAGREVTVELTW